jgi:hypothetical protein
LFLWELARNKKETKEGVKGLRLKKKENEKRKMRESSAIYSSIEESLINSSNPFDNTKIKGRTRIDPLVWHKVAAIFGTANFIQFLIISSIKLL